MAVTLRPNEIKLRTQTGEYQSPVVLGDTTVADHVAQVNAAITAKGEETLESIPEDYTELSGEVADLKSALNDDFNTVIGKNLVNPSKLVTGAIQSDGTVATNGTYANYSTSEFIEVESDGNYVFTAYGKSSHTASSLRKLCLLYDADKQSITSSHQNTTGVTSLYIATGTAKYVRVSAETGFDFQLEAGTEATAYAAYTAVVELAKKLGNTPMDQVIEQIDFKMSKIIGSKNLADPSKFTTGAIQSDGTVATNGSWANYKTTDFIPLSPDTDYVISGYYNNALDSQHKLYVLYDANKNADATKFVNQTGVTSLTFNSGSYAYIRFSEMAGISFQIETGTTPSAYSPYELVMNYKLGDVPVDQLAGIFGDKLYGKKWAVCGDSFTDGATATTIDSGLYAGKKYVYPYLIGNRTGMDIVKFFQSGRTLAYPADESFTNSLTCPEAECYYQNIPSTVDYITIYLGINDSHHAGHGSDGEDTTGSIPLGTITDGDNPDDPDDPGTSTYLGAWNVVLTWLIKNRPNAHIGIIVTNGIESNDEYRQGQIAIAKKYGVPYIDLNGDARTPAMLRTSNPDIPQRVKTEIFKKWAVNYGTNNHPNDDAHLYESMFIEEFLRSI